MSERTVLIPVTGAFNPSIRLFQPTKKGLQRAVHNPIGAAHYQRITSAAEDAGLEVEKPIVLERMGIQHPEKTQEQVTIQVRKRLERNEAARAILLGHSLGGVIVTAIASSGEFDDQIIGVETLGSPHEGANDQFFAPLMFIAKTTGFARIFGANDLYRELPDYASRTLQQARVAVSSGKLCLAFVGSPYDNLVALSSAISPRAGAELHAVVCADDEVPVDNSVSVHALPEQVSHIGLLTNKQVASYVVSLAAEISAKHRKFPHSKKAA